MRHSDDVPAPFILFMLSVFGGDNEGTDWVKNFYLYFVDTHMATTVHQLRLGSILWIVKRHSISSLEKGCEIEKKQLRSWG